MNQNYYDNFSGILINSLEELDKIWISSSFSMTLEAFKLLLIIIVITVGLVTSVAESFESSNFCHHPI